MGATSIAVVGAGFSGTLVSLHLLRRCPPGTRITLIERNRQFGLGLTELAIPAICSTCRLDG